MQIDSRHPRAIRDDIRKGRITGTTAGMGQNYVQANLAILPREHAYDFLLFCQRNPQACPLIEVTDPGNPEPAQEEPSTQKLEQDVPGEDPQRRETRGVPEGNHAPGHLPDGLAEHVTDPRPETGPQNDPGQVV